MTTVGWDTNNTTNGVDTSWTVPAGVYSLALTLYGAGGRRNNNNYNGSGAGGFASCTVSVTPGETLTIRPGWSGGAGYGGMWPGGGNGGNIGGTYGGGGGGYSGIFRGTTPLCIAAGGGGEASYNGALSIPQRGADGGGYTGNGSNNAYQGGGGTPTSGGAGGGNGGAGSSLQGGSGANSLSYLGGGGGGGYFGGGAGAGTNATPSQSGGGGGGSSFTSGSSQTTTTSGGSAQGVGGSVSIVYSVIADVPTSPSPASGTRTHSTGSQAVSATVSSPDGANCAALFRWSTDPAFGTYTDVQGTTVASGGSSTATLVSLPTDSHIYLRVFDNNGNGFSNFVSSDFYTNYTPSVPTVTYPNGGEQVDAASTFTATWSASTDPDGDAVTYDIDYSNNNGTSWSSVTTGYSSTSLTINISSFPNSSTMLMRVRAKDAYGGISAYDTSNAAFTIYHTVTASGSASSVTTPDFRIFQAIASSVATAAGLAIQIASAIASAISNALNNGSVSTVSGVGTANVKSKTLGANQQVSYYTHTEQGSQSWSNINTPESMWGST